MTPLEIDLLVVMFIGFVGTYALIDLVSKHVKSLHDDLKKTDCGIEEMRKRIYYHFKVKS
jgi:uncharacterized membrane-anchored protein YhcB (DUF1043 family)